MNLGPAVDNVETQVIDVYEVPTPSPVPAKPMSFDDADTRRRKFQGPPKDNDSTKMLSPNPPTIASSVETPPVDLDQDLLDAAAEAHGVEVLDQSKNVQWAWTTIMKTNLNQVHNNRYHRLP